MADNKAVDKNKYKLKNGYVILKEYASRKLAKDYNKALYGDMEAKGGVSVGQGAEDASAEDASATFAVKISNIEDAKEILVIRMIERAVINDQDVSVDQSFIDNMHAEDFAELSEHCRLIAFGDDKQKKSS